LPLKTDAASALYPHHLGVPRNKINIKNDYQPVYYLKTIPASLRSKTRHRLRPLPHHSQIKNKIANFSWNSNFHRSARNKMQFRQFSGRDSITIRGGWTLTFLFFYCSHHIKYFLSRFVLLIKFCYYLYFWS
jgi:hypothetical protein